MEGFDLFNQPVFPERDGQTFDATLDGERLAAQHARIKALMQDGRFRTLDEISDGLRDFRKERFGKLTVDRRRRSKGLHEYRLQVA
jgi:hypothetical protein